MNDTIDQAIQSAFVDLVARTPELGPTPLPAHQPPALNTAHTDAYSVALGTSRTRSRSRRVALLGSAVVAAAGLAVFVLIESREASAPSPMSPSSVPATPGTIPFAPVEDENSTVPWDEVAIAPGTVGWFQLGDIPPALSARIGQAHHWSHAYTSQFFQCETWTETDSKIACSKLAGGNYISHNSYGADVEVGVQLGDGLEPAAVLWQLAQGSLWGYDTVTTPPEPVQVPIGTITGWSYRNDDDLAYLVWERAPGEIVWLKTQGFTDVEMSQLATVTEPAVLPAALPVLIPIGTSVTDLNGLERRLKLASFDGIRCVGISMFNQCTRVDQGPALVRSLDGSAPTVAAVAPIGTAASLVVTLGNGERVEVALTDARLGLETAIYSPPAGVTMLRASVNDSTGAPIQTLELAPSSDQPAQTTSAAPTTSILFQDGAAVPGISLSISSASTTNSEAFATTVDGVLTAAGVSAERRDDATRGISTGVQVEWAYFLETNEPRRIFLTVGPADELEPSYVDSAGVTRTQLSDAQTLYTWPGQPSANTLALVTNTTRTSSDPKASKRPTRLDQYRTSCRSSRHWLSTRPDDSMVAVSARGGTHATQAIGMPFE